MAAPISAPFFPLTMPPTPAPEAAEPPITMAVFCHDRVSVGALSSLTRTRSSIRAGVAVRDTVHCLKRRVVNPERNRPVS